MYVSVGRFFPFHPVNAFHPILKNALALARGLKDCALEEVMRDWYLFATDW